MPFDTEEPSRGALIKIYRHRGRIVATVSQYQWYEPDGHKYTGYADVETSPPRPADEVLAEYKKLVANVAVESDDLWNPAWGTLR